MLRRLLLIAWVTSPLYIASRLLGSPGPLAESEASRPAHSIDGSLQVLLPQSWKQIGSDHHRKVFADAIEAESDSTHLRIRSEFKKHFPDLDLATYAKHAMVLHESEEPVDSPAKLQVNGCPAIRYETRSIAEPDRVFLRIFVETRATYVRLEFDTDAQFVKDHQSSITGIVQSISVNEKAATATTRAADDDPARLLRLKVEVMRDGQGTWSCFLIVINLSPQPVEVPTLPAYISFGRRELPRQDGAIGGEGVIMHQRVRRTRRIDPDEGFVARLPVDCSKPGAYEIKLRLRAGLEVNAVVKVPQ
jgi:hypothetical protein